MPARRFTRADLVTYLLDVERDLGKENHVGASGKAARERDPAGIATHQLHHHHPVVTFGRGVKPVYRLGGGTHRRVVAEGALRAAHVIVNRLGHADDRHTLLPQIVSDREATVAADGDE